MIRLSVIVPCYRFARYIGQCLDSILMQKTNFDFEVLVRDDFSQDGTEEIVAEYARKDKRVVLFNSKVNWGAYENIRFLMNRCTREYVAYIDGDDFYSREDVLQHQVDFLDSHLGYVMHSIAYEAVNEEGTPLHIIRNTDYYYHRPLFPVITLQDLLTFNYVSFGRMWRNMDVDAEWVRYEKFVDWGFNFEFARQGCIYAEDFLGGVYRYNSSGTITIMGQGDIDEANEAFRAVLRRKFDEYNSSNNKPCLFMEVPKIKRNHSEKVITIVDAYVNNSKIIQLAFDCIKKLKESGQDVLLITNFVPTESLLSLTDYCVYDSHNRLFDTSKFTYSGIDLWWGGPNLEFHSIVHNVQRHGLSVLYNLFTALHFAKSLGYTHFQRVEADDVMGEASIAFLQSVPEKCRIQDMSGLFYCNADDVSFHYFYCEIDGFLRIVPKIESDVDYLNFLNLFYGNNEFRLIENYVFTYIKDNEKLLLRPGVEMKVDFPDTDWNTYTSTGNLPAFYEGCMVNLYLLKKEDHSLIPNRLVIIARNFSGEACTRIVEVLKGSTYRFHTLPNGYQYEVIEYADSIQVFDSDYRFLYQEEAKNIQNWTIIRS